jgi:hypothetical protein
VCRIEGDGVAIKKRNEREASQILVDEEREGTILCFVRIIIFYVFSSDEMYTFKASFFFFY